MLVFAAISEKGNREINEDSIELVTEGNTGYFVLADGLGGHGKGEVASGIVTKKAKEHMMKTPGDLDGCFIEGQNLLIDEQRKTNSRDELKTTMVCLYIHGSKARWAHIGDSRIYYFKEEKLITRSLDHSVSQMLAAIGEIREKDIRGHVDRNRLTRVMGMDWDVPKYELGEEITLDGTESFLLCSDGFWEWILEKDMEKTLRKATTPGQWLESMKSIVVKNGEGNNMDNYSAIAVFT